MKSVISILGVSHSRLEMPERQVGRDTHSGCWFKFKVHNHEQLLNAKRKRQYHHFMVDAIVYNFQVSYFTRGGSQEQTPENSEQFLVSE